MENGAKQICDLVSPTIARRWRKSTERFSLGASCRRSSLKSSPEISIRNFADAFACRARGRRGGKRDREGEGGKEQDSWKFFKILLEILRYFPARLRRFYELLLGKKSLGAFYRFILDYFCDSLIFGSFEILQTSSKISL